MRNKDYVALLDAEENCEECQKKRLRAMEKYGDNHWWEKLKEDPCTFAYYQLHEPILMISPLHKFDFYRAVGVLLGREVMYWEFWFKDDDSYNRFIEKAEQAWKKRTEVS